MQTGTSACAVTGARARRMGQVVMILAGLALVTASGAKEAGNRLPPDAWRANGPGTGPGAPPAFASHLGLFRSPGEAYAALSAWAATHHTADDPRIFSDGLVEVAEAESFTFRQDRDGNGEVDTHLFSHALHEFGQFPRNCSRGDGTRDITGGVIEPTAALVYEPALEPGARTGPKIAALCARVYCQTLTGCSGVPGVSSFKRVALPVYNAVYDANPLQCEAGRHAVAEDLLGRASGSAFSCRHDGGLEREANLGGDCPSLANGTNPVNTVSGNKYQREQDYAGTVHGELRFVRHYNSQQDLHRDLGLGWTHSYSANLTVTTAGNGDQTARLQRPDGRLLVFNRPAARAAFGADPLTVGVLRAVPGAQAFEYVDAEDVVERYEQPVTVGRNGSSVARYLFAAREDVRHGRHEILRYDARRRLLRVEGRFGRALLFERDTLGRIAAIIDPAGRRYRYAYDDQLRLVSVRYPDDNDRADQPASFDDNPRREYRYTDADWPKGLTDIVDESGTVYAHWTYDGQGRALSSEHAGGAGRVQLDYQPAYTAISDARGQTRTYNTRVEYGIGLIAAVSGGNCNFCGAGPLAATTYDDNGHRNLVTDHLGNVTDYDIDARGLELRRVEGSGASRRVIDTRWRADLRLPLDETVSDAAGRALKRVSYTYRGPRLASRSEADLAAGGPTRTTRYQWFGDDDPADPRAGLLAAVDGPREDVADVTRFDYDPATGNLRDITDALGHVTRFTAHDAEGRALRMIDPNGIETRFEYDARGRLLARSVADVRTGFQYDARGLLLAVLRGDGSRLDFTYDAAQRLVRVADALGNHIDYELDALGNRTAERVIDTTGTLQRQLWQTFDQRNQLASVTGGELQTTHYDYDANGALVSASDPRGTGLPHSLERDPLQRVIASVDGAGQRTAFTYDALGGVTSVTDPRGLVTRYLRDAFGNAVREESPDAGLTEYRHDSAGNRVSRTHTQRAGVPLSTSYVYDALDRLVKIDFPTDADLEYVYDDPTPGRNAIGRLSAMTDASGATQFDYDGRGNLVRRALAAVNGTHVLGYRFDGADRLHGIDYPSGLHLDIERDAAGQVSRLRATHAGGSVDIARDIAWYAFGGLLRATFGNGLVETRDYDRAGRLTAITSGTASLPSYRYPGYDAADNLLEAEEQYSAAGISVRRARHFRYDASNRLVREDHGPDGLSFAYAFDANGNRTARDEINPDGTVFRRIRYQVGSGSNRVYGATPRGDDYDLAGNLLRHHVGYRLNADGSRTDINPDLGLVYRYDEAGRLRAALKQVSIQWSALYNGQGQRSVKFNRGDTRQPTVYLYAETGELLAAISTGGGRPRTWREYVWLDGRPLAEIVTVEGQAVPRVSWLHVNHQNQLQYMTDGSGRMTLWSTGGDAYGFGGKNDLDVDRDGVVESPALLHGYPGQINDGPVFSNGFRDYSPGLGRYLQSDPKGLAGGINTFVYAAGNPLRFQDASGLDPFGCGPGEKEVGLTVTGQKICQPVPGGLPPGGSNAAPFCLEGQCAALPGKMGFNTGPFGTTCGPSRDPVVASWVPDWIWKSACEKHDKCYGTCGISKAECDRSLLLNSSNPVYYVAVLLTGAEPYKAAQKASGCDCTE